MSVSDASPGLSIAQSTADCEACESRTKLVISERQSEASRPYLVYIAKFASPSNSDAVQKAQKSNAIDDAILRRFYLQSLARDLLPGERVTKCLRQIVPGQQSVEVVADLDKNTAHYRNLLTCGRLWFCPVCASKITERRAGELLQAVTKWTGEAGFVALLTFTLRHNAGDELLTVLDALRSAHRRFKVGKSFKLFRDRFAWMGSITALEVTHGEHGWHPHLHELVFFGPLAAERWRAFPDVATSRWLRALAAEGRDATWAHGLDVRDAETDVYDYVAKFGHLPRDSRWTLERELAKAPAKQGRDDGRTPFALLDAFGSGDQDAGLLFQEYARVFKGRRQLVWSRGLRALLDLDSEASDEALAADLPDPLVVLAALSRSEWRSVLALPRDVRGELLVVARRGDAAAVAAFLTQFGVLVGGAAAAESASPS